MENNTSIKENTFEYSINPFTPNGKMNRIYYLIYIFTISLICKTLEICITEMEIFNNIRYALSAFIVSVVFLVFQLFITKKRILDITNDTKKSWTFASLFIVSAIILSMIRLTLILLPFGLYILLKGPYKTNKDSFKAPEALEASETDNRE